MIKFFSKKILDINILFNIIVLFKNNNNSQIKQNLDKNEQKDII